MATTVQILGDELLAEHLRIMQKRAINMRRPLTKFGAVVRRHNRAQWRSKGLAGGAPWAPLSPKYAAWKVKVVGPKPLMRFSDDLWKSLTRNPMGVQDIGWQRAEFGTDVEYAEFHQYGTRFMPARPIVTTTPLMEKELGRLVSDHITNVVKGA